MITVGISDTITDIMLDGLTVADPSRGAVVLEGSAPMDSKVCVLCGTTYVRKHIRPDQWAKSRYCSPECYHVGRGAETHARDRAAFGSGELPVRLLSKIDVGDCWIWTGSISNGYGTIKWAGEVLPAHRVVWRVLVGPILAGMQLDHLCRNRRCCNPDHLEVVTQRVNMLRGYGAGAQKARRTTCPQGHPYDTLNRNGLGVIARRCKQCNNEKSKRYQERKAAVSW